MAAHGEKLQYGIIRQSFNRPPGSERILERMNRAQTGLMHALLNDVGHARNDHRNSGSPVLKFLEQGNNLIPVVEGALDDGAVGNTCQDVIHGGVVDIAGFHIPQIYGAMFVAYAQKFLRPGSRPCFVYAGCRATQHHKVIFQLLVTPPPM